MLRMLGSVKSDYATELMEGDIFTAYFTSEPGWGHSSGVKALHTVLCLVRRALSPGRKARDVLCTLWAKLLA